MCVTRLFYRTLYNAPQWTVFWASLYNYVFGLVLIALLLLSLLTFLIPYLWLPMSLVMFKLFFLTGQEVRNICFDYLLDQHLCYLWISKAIWWSMFYAVTSKFPSEFSAFTQLYFLCKDRVLEEWLHLLRVKLGENESGPLMLTKCFKNIKEISKPL